MKPINLFRISIFVIPFVIVAIPAIPQWLGRTIASSILIFSFTVAVFWYGISSKTKMILPGAKLNQPQYDSVRPTIERNIRILVVLFGAFFAWYITIPFSIDLARLVAGEKPIEITRVVRRRSVPLFGLYFIEQSVKISEDSKTKSLYYSWEPIRAGETYEFVFLPRSQIIIEFHGPK
jgi:hypothetical protein